MSVLKIKDALGNWIKILTIKGDKGDTGAQGAQGIPGVSPTIAVSDIPDGHRVTITDADHPGGISFDVMDGSDADAPVQDVLINGASIVDANGDANISTGSQSAYGVFKTPTAIQLKNLNTSTVITSSLLPEGTFYALAKVASDTSQSASSNTVGNYTENAKSAIHEMLSGSITISGTTPTINALPGLRYICGECSALTVNLPASGCVDIQFESGSTPTVLTVNPASGQTVKWANGFDPTSLDADTTYEINVADGLGVCGSW